MSEGHQSKEHRPPGPQTCQPDDHPRGYSEGHGFRHRPRLDVHRPNLNRDIGHALLHISRAYRGKTGPGRSHRHVFPGSVPLSDADRRIALHR